MRTDVLWSGGKMQRQGLSIFPSFNLLCPTRGGGPLAQTVQPGA